MHSKVEKTSESTHYAFEISYTYKKFAKLQFYSLQTSFNYSMQRERGWKVEICKVTKQNSLQQHNQLVLINLCTANIVIRYFQLVSCDCTIILTTSALNNVTKPITT